MSMETASADKPAALDFKMKSLDGKEVDLGKYQGKVVMVVNVASKCGLTPQYKQLQALYEKHQKRRPGDPRLPLQSIPASEPGTAEEIQKFCTVNYGVSFPLFAKIEVNGDGACPLYKHLTALDAKPAGRGRSVGTSRSSSLAATARLPLASPRGPGPMPRKS